MKRGRVSFTPAAREDVIEIASGYREISPKLSSRFKRSFRSAIDLLAAMPLIGAPREIENPRLVGLRMWSVTGFEKYLIYYLPENGGILVVRILHGARDVESILRSESITDLDAE